MPLRQQGLRQQEGQEDMVEFFKSFDDFDPDYARGMIQGIVEAFEEQGVNMIPILQDALTGIEDTIPH